MKKSLNWFQTFAILLITIGILYTILFITRRCTDDGVEYVQVRQTWLDSLQAQANQPPDTVTITIDSVIYVKGPVEYVEVPVTQPVDSVTNYVPDILRSEHFTLFLFDTLRYNRIISRGFNYELHVPKEIIKTITVLHPVPFPYKVKEPGWLYGGVNAGNVISADLSVKKDANWYGAGIGYANRQRFYYFRYQRRIL